VSWGEDLSLHTNLDGVDAVQKLVAEDSLAMLTCEDLDQYSQYQGRSPQGVLCERVLFSVVHIYQVRFDWTVATERFNVVVALQRTLRAGCRRLL